MVSRSELLTARFYEWEERGRGWRAFECAVEPEPQFFPFFGHFSPIQTIADTGRRHTLASGLIDLFSGKKKEAQPQRDDLHEIPPVAAYPYEKDNNLAAYGIILSKDEKISIEDMEQLLLMLSFTAHPISFEIIGTVDAIRLQIVCREIDETHLCSQVKAYFPAAVISKTHEGLNILADNTETCVLDFGLSDEFMLPLRMADDLAHDPYAGLFAALEILQRGERGIIQVLFKGAINPWAESIMRSVTDGKGGSFFADAPGMVKQAENKISAPLFAVCVKVAGQAARSERAISIAKGIGAALIRLTASPDNSLQILPQEAYAMDDLIDDMFLRQSHRLGMLLNSGELATLAHLPTSEIFSTKLERDTRKTRRAPESAQGHQFVLGLNTHQGHEQLVSVPASLRLRHTHIIGATGTGKSTLLLAMITQDMRLGNGIAVLDPHGDLIESILAYVPKERIADVILIDPADGDFPVAFNILSAHSEIEKEILASDLVAAFRRLSTSWGDQMNSVLANAILAFLESTQGGTLVDLRRFLVEKVFRDAYLKTVQDPHIAYYWEHEYPLLKSSSIGSILTRLDTFLRPKLIRNMVAQKKGLDFEQILDTKKILLVKLSQGLIGEENSHLLGTFFVAKIYQAAMARQAKLKADRTDFFCYIDEFHHFATPSLSNILNGTRKYNLGLILAHQDMAQLNKYDTELASAVVNASTRICFRLGDTDAKRFAGGFSYFEAEDLENLRTGEAIARIEQPNYDFNLAILPLPELQEREANEMRQIVIAKSRERYGTLKERIETALQQSLPIVTEKVEITQQESPQTDVSDIIQKPEPTPSVASAEALAYLPKKTETQHRYLQTLIKRMAESRGYKATLEQKTPDGKGRVDVSLERDNKRIAVEISVTTSDTWEVHNIEKCLNAGYAEVIVCSNDAQNLERIRRQIDIKLKHNLTAKVYTLSSREVIQYFDNQIVEEQTEEVIKGFRVKVEYGEASSKEIGQKRENIIKAVSNSIKKNKQI